MYQFGLVLLFAASVRCASAFPATPDVDDSVPMMPAIPSPVLQGPRRSIRVSTSLGVLEGSCGTNNVCQFLGVGFAQPPLAALRWKPAQAVGSLFTWTDRSRSDDHADVHVAAGQPPSCTQVPSLAYDPHNEDCLYLNIFTPASQLEAMTDNGNGTAAPLPVMVWWYGGSFTSGGISLFLYQADQIVAQQQVVVVTANYRLGILGWAVSDELSKEDPDWPTSGNYGSTDQQQSLKWVQSHITSFGGDTSRVTIFGESAGSMSVCFQMVAPSSAALFDRVIMESGPCLQGAISPQPQYNYDVVKARTLEVMNAPTVNCSDFICMRTIDPNVLVEAGPSTWSPVIDGVFIPDDPLTLFQSSKYHAPGGILYGANTDEGTMFLPGPWNMTDDEYQALLLTSFGSTNGPLVYQQYPPNEYATPAYAAARVVGDYFFICPGRRMAAITSRSGTPTYAYHFAHVPSWVVCPGIYCSEVKLGVFHSSELSFVWGHPMPLETFTGDEQILSSGMISAWTSFATNGVPVFGGGVAAWPQYQFASDLYMHLNTTTYIETGFQRSGCDFWDTITA